MSRKINTQQVSDWILECSRVIDINVEALNDLDSTCGDADHGSNLQRGFTAVIEVERTGKVNSPREIFKRVGSTIVDEVGGSSGALYGTFFLRMAIASGTLETLDGPTFALVLKAGGQGIVDRGQAQVGDKTLYDALAPAIVALELAVSDGQSLSQALAAAADAADKGRDSTTEMVARKGRASYLGERSIGYPDAGATSMALILRAAVHTLA